MQVCVLRLYKRVQEWYCQLVVNDHRNTKLPTNSNRFILTELFRPYLGHRQGAVTECKDKITISCKISVISSSCSMKTPWWWPNSAETCRSEHEWVVFSQPLMWYIGPLLKSDRVCITPRIILRFSGVFRNKVSRFTDLFNDTFTSSG
jgi:hypothetical protein